MVQTFELAKSANCTYSPALCLASFLDSVKAVDDYTVEFTTKTVLSSFMLGYLATTNIESKDAVDASYAKYLEATKAVTPAELKTFLDKVTAEETKPTGPPAEGSTDPTVNYTQFTAEAEALLTKAGQGFADKALYTGEDGTRRRRRVHRRQHRPASHRSRRPRPPARSTRSPRPTSTSTSS